jgi:hypothetical protein
VKVPVRWWHGDTDHVVRSGESHLGGFAKIDEVLEYMRSQL